MIHEQNINGVPATTIAEAVESIEAQEGICHPAALVAKARPKRSPLHSLFDWDDARAAGQWRVEQARRVIRSVRVEVINQEAPAPAFVHVTKVTDQGVLNGYMSTRLAMASHGADVLADALAQLTGLQNRYAQLSELGPVWDALTDVQTELAEAA